MAYIIYYNNFLFFFVGIITRFNLQLNFIAQLFSYLKCISRIKRSIIYFIFDCSIFDLPGYWAYRKTLSFNLVKMRTERNRVQKKKLYIY